ncbi:putative zinc-binding oxidoreductase [Xylogone sp. PMI_703]|nr:putative zinc-binding oxidoreductase [Xylogone sp. PMI_703]
MPSNTRATPDSNRLLTLSLLVAILAVLVGPFLAYNLYFLLEPLCGSLFSSASSIDHSMSARVVNGTMRAIVVHEKGGPEVLKFHHNYPRPVPEAGEVLIRVKAFGLNRAEMFTRQGHSPGVVFPRILGIEATGVVEEAPSNEFTKGQTVITAMGDMGRMYDGGYAEFTCVKATQVKPVNTTLPWSVLGALPETMQTAWGSLFGPLKLQSGDRLLIRGGTTTIGLAAAALAKNHGAFVISTTRKADREAFLREQGVDDVIIDTGSIADEIHGKYPEGVDKVLELVGVITMADSLKTLKVGGIVCMTGIAGGKWVLDSFTPNMIIPKGRYLTTYGGTSADLLATPLDYIAKLLEDGKVKLPIKTFEMEDIVQAHQFMEFEGGAKVVVLVP